MLQKKFHERNDLGRNLVLKQTFSQVSKLQFSSAGLANLVDSKQEVIGLNIHDL